jgi:tRNA-dihydrouridine synthase 1
VSELDQPCFAQFCGHDPEILLAATKLIQDKTPCVDLNLGCPQGIARKGHYGAFLLENEELVLKILNYLSNNSKCAISCKIRLFSDLNRSFEFVKKIEETGIKVLTVHGRTKYQNKNLVGTSNWDAIKIIKEATSLPIIANGSIESYEDVQRCFDITNCDAVMSSEKLLEHPFLFSGQMHDIDDVAIEFLNLAKEHHSNIDSCRAHLFKFFYQACKLNNDFNDRLVLTRTYDGFLELANEVKEFRKHFRNEEKFGWYYRYRKEDNPFQESLNCDDNKHEVEIKQPPVEELCNFSDLFD